jgi:hypothetical protein
VVSTALSDNDRTLLAELTKHPGWAVLARVVEENAERKALSVAKQLLHTLDPVNQEQLFYDRGYWQAMTDLISKPERAARQTKEQ